MPVLDPRIPPDLIPAIRLLQEEIATTLTPPLSIVAARPAEWNQWLDRQLMIAGNLSRAVSRLLHSNALPEDHSTAPPTSGS